MPRPLLPRSRFLVRGAACALFATALVMGCIDMGPTSSSSSSTGGGTSSSGGDGGDADPGVSADRAALCATYATNTATCCTQTPGTCPSDKEAFWSDSCLKYARSCAAMPTCFSGADCNTLIYCTGTC